MKRSTVFQMVFSAPLVLIAYIFFAPFLNVGYLYTYKAVRSIIHVTDPDNPRFTRDTFDPRDYAFEADLVNALRKMFPKNTPRSVVDSVLSDKGFAQLMSSKDGTAVYYIFPERFVPLPTIQIRKPGDKGDWWIEIDYTKPGTPGDKSKMFLISCERRIHV